MSSLHLFGRTLLCILLSSSLQGCSAQPHASKPAQEATGSTTSQASLSAEKAEILKVVRKIYETPTRKYLCPNTTPSIKNEVHNRFADVFSAEVLEQFILMKTRCEVLASARYGFNPLDTPEAINQAYSLIYSEPFKVHTATIVEVRFRPIINDKPGAEGGAIVYLRKNKAGWRISNIESVDMLGANGFQSLIPDYPTVSNDTWADMDYSRSLVAPTPRQ